MRILKHNRNESKSPKKVLFWCGCDRDLVSGDKKCSVCGVRSHKVRRFKKCLDIEKSFCEDI